MIGQSPLVSESLTWGKAVVANAAALQGAVAKTSMTLLQAPHPTAVLHTAGGKSPLVHSATTETAASHVAHAAPLEATHVTATKVGSSHMAATAKSAAASPHVATTTAHMTAAVTATTTVVLGQGRTGRPQRQTQQRGTED